MAKLESLGIKGLESVHWDVSDLERSRRFYVNGLDFTERGVSSPELEAKGKQKSAVFQAGQIVLVVSQPVGEGGR
ncbi:MAG TPA: 4-hydroxyphenylpyruvate dioxygenase, partial [Archangium sp.]